MAHITSTPFIRHLRAEPTMHVLRYRRGKLAAEGAGRTFWFQPRHTAVAEVPLDDRELPFLFQARSADYQEVAVQGAIAFRVGDPRLLAQRVDFTIDLLRGTWEQAPLDQVAGLLSQLAQQLVVDDLARRDLRSILADGVAPVLAVIGAGLAGEPAFEEVGLDVVAVLVAAITPSPDIDKALRQPAREAIQQRADEATFARRALAVDKERAIAENELANQVELARRSEELVAREGANERRREEERAAAAQVAADAEDARRRLSARQRADAIDLVEGAKVRSERERADLQAAIPVEALLAIALRELAAELGKVEHLTITPDLLAPLLGRVAAGAGAREGER